MVLVTSGAAWAGGATLAAYGATKAFDLILAESLWAEWRTRGVDVLGLVLGKTDTPSMRRAFDAEGKPYGELADPDEVAAAALDHLADGPPGSTGRHPDRRFPVRRAQPTRRGPRDEPGRVRARRRRLTPGHREFCRRCPR